MADVSNSAAVANPAARGAPAAPAASPAVAPRGLRNPRVRLGLSVLGALALAVALVVGLRWWVYGRFIESTDDAYLRADVVTVEPRVGGYVQALYVQDNQQVAAGQPLLRIDVRNYQAALSQQSADLDARRAGITFAENQVRQQQALVTQNRAQLAGTEANARFAAGEEQRYRMLRDEGVETEERYEQALNQKNQAQASLQAARAGVSVAERQLATMQSALSQSRAQLQSAQAQVNTAELNLGDTLLRASVAGRIGDDTARLGEYVAPGTRLMSIVPVRDVYAVANFKETQIRRMRIGQSATVRVDALGDRLINARVESFSPGTGAQFALLPPENATGNFIKIVQRVPVRLHLLPPADLAERLLPGLSVTVSVDTRQESSRAP
ncbi:MAG TPA: HlyD family secretion protein [Steroidobacteraceae bacterium]|jgi:membrane fusion protein (multidrug efflux system)|nr:HlyD family secretion protein [Steroidobacteraceae bacterium]